MWILRTSGMTALLITLLAAAGCYGYQRGSSYPDQRYSCNNCGVVEDVRRVNVNDDRIGLGAIIGAAVGAAVGHQVGDGSGQDAATAAGAIGGAVVGHNVEKKRRGSRAAYQFFVELDDGRNARVTQMDHYGIREGDRVRIVGEELRPVG